ncbi:hypothetical protein Droror1_Dr00005177 [Drosera rotundifolia]
MECVETPLKWSIKQGKTASPPSPPSLVLVDDDYSWAANTVSGGSGDEAFVDELLLDFNNDNTEQGALEPACVENTEEDENNHLFSSSPPTKLTEHHEDAHKDDFGSVFSVPVDEPQLEWLSQFVEDSFSAPTPYPSRATFLTNAQHRPCPASSRPTSPVVTTKSKRTHRGRTSSTGWSFASVSRTISSSSSSSSTTSFPPNGIVLSSSPMSSKKKRTMTRAVVKGEVTMAHGMTPRRCCSHCGVHKTPQWREGPGGSRTLCNACGVRFKKGRLLPEYRPANSPTFSSKLHSNRHQKVMEMRRMKDEMMTKAASSWGAGGCGGGFAVARSVSGYL